MTEEMTKRDYEKDILILVFRLMDEPLDSFAPETAEVMEWYMDKAREVLEGRREI